MGGATEREREREEGQQAFEHDVQGWEEREMSRNKRQTQGDIMKSCDEGRRFKVGEVDSEERSRTMMTKNKPFNVALWGHGLPLNSAS